MPTTTRACKGCGSTTRELKHPGPRCTTCWRIERKRRRETAHSRHVESVYGLVGDGYAVLLAFQGGACAICGRARGIRKKLAVDHDHHLGCGHDPATGCPACVRGLLCAWCNRVIGRAHDDPEWFARAYHYLLNPPARQALRVHDRL